MLSAGGAPSQPAGQPASQQPPTRVFPDLDVGAVHGADDEGAVERKLHVGGARGLGAGGGDVLAELSCRDDDLRLGDVVIGQEDHLEQVPHLGVGVDLQGGGGMGQAPVG